MPSKFFFIFLFFFSVLADALLLYRCYAIWDYNIRVVLGPIILLVAGTGSLPFSLKHQRVTNQTSVKSMWLHS